MKVFSVAFPYDHPHTGKVLILKLNQAIHFETMDNNLVCLMKLKMNDMNIFDYSTFVIDNPSRYDHSILISREGGKCYNIPLSHQNTLQLNGKMLSHMYQTDL